MHIATHQTESESVRLEFLYGEAFILKCKNTATKPTVCIAAYDHPTYANTLQKTSFPKARHAYVIQWSLAKNYGI